MASHSFPFVGVHLDLKYTMPRKEYLQRWLREIAASGINTLLLEYEDKFPFEKCSFLRAQDAFTPEELHSFLQTARESGIKVIPLVQTLSHLEFALAHTELAHLREAPDILTQINPSNPDALQFVHEMIDEVLTYHEEDEYFHLGADETWFVGTNPDYADEVKAMGLPAYWARHMRPYIEKIIAAGKRPLVWDDVFWNDPASVKNFDLPRELILVSWDYVLRESDTAMETLVRVDAYRQAGFEVVGAPCLNWGVLTPMHDHVLENTEAWAHKAKQSGMMGIINTGWSVFHTPLPTQMPYITATATLLETETTKFEAAQLKQWATEYFGIHDSQLQNALRDLSASWEQSVEGYGRPLTPIIYGYMDMVLFYKNQQNRMKCGSYPLDWNDVDFNALYRQKIQLLRELEDQATLSSKLDELQSTFKRASDFFAGFAQRVQHHSDEARLFSCFADMKELHTRVTVFLLLKRGNESELLSELKQQNKLLENCLAPFYEPAGVARLLKLWAEPATTMLTQNNDSY
jgi:hypothetical protein